MGNKVLLIEDDRQLVELLRKELSSIGFSVDAVHDGLAGIDKAAAGDFDLILLDLGLPKLDGVEVCKRIRERDKDVAIILLTSRSDETSKVVLLEIGGDDFITKPFDLSELKARVKAVLRRTIRREKSASGPLSIVRFRDLVIDLDKRRVTLRGEAVTLTAREFDLLSVLVTQRGRPFSREDLNTEVYGHQVTGYEQSVSSHICRIRSKIERDPDKPEYILTVRGVGYCFSDDEE